MTEREDLSRYKGRLREYLERRGVEITRTDADRISCLNASGHARGDSHASMIVYDEVLHCPVCGENMDIFEAARVVAGLSTAASEFPKVIEEVKSTLGELSAPAPARAAPAPTPKKPRGENCNAVSLPIAEARQVYVRSAILSLASKSLRANVTAIEGTWSNFDADGRLAFAECRFPASCFEDGKKKYLTFWYDGRHLRAASPPIALYNRDKLADPELVDLPVCIHEGPKSIFGMPAAGDRPAILGAETIPGFIHSGWNSGGKKLALVDFEPLRGRNVYVYPDDDAPGRKTALEVQRLLGGIAASCRICEPLPEARTIKPEAADIIEALQVKSPEELADYIRNGPGLCDGKAGSEARGESRDSRLPPRTAMENVQGLGAMDESNSTREGSGENNNRPGVTPPHPPVAAPAPDLDPEALPFKILGTADDGLTYFLDEAEHLQRFRLSSLSKGQLLVLAPLSFWASEFGHKGRPEWDSATDFIIRVAAAIDFDPEQRRGRGAWRERDGRICYHDGRRTIGEADPKRLYIRKTQIDIGLEDAPASPEVRREILDAAAAMSFETQADCCRCLAWASLSPYAGALPWRPAGFLTGPSSSGKSTIIDRVIRPLSCARSVSGGDSSAAGIRQWVGNDAAGVIVEEAEDDTKRKRERREEIFSLMRMSTSDEAPPAVKGTIDGQPVQFALRSMFLFAAISPEIESIADQNRFAMIVLKKPDGDWSSIKARVVRAITEDYCRGVRAFTWAHLKEIITDADRIADAIQTQVRLDSRTSYAEAILFSAFWRVFKDKAPDAGELAAFIAAIYKQQAPEERRDEAIEIIERILDEAVPVLGERAKTYTLRRILYGIKFGKGPGDGETATLDGMRVLTAQEVAQYRATAIQYGLGVDTEGDLAIANEHHKIREISGHGKGYKAVLWRHPCVHERSRNINFENIGDRQRRCTTLRGVLANDEVPF